MLTRETYPLHDSQRGWFARELYFSMQKDRRIWLLTGDLGYGMLDHIQEDFPDRFVNTGAAEQAMLGAAVGLTYEGQIPFCYSITSFLLYRPFEWLRNYVQHEGAPVRLVGSGLNKDYAHDGYTHHSCDAPQVLNLLNRIRQYYPDTCPSVALSVGNMIATNEPSFIALRR